MYFLFFFAFLQYINSPFRAQWTPPFIAWTGILGQLSLSLWVGDDFGLYRRILLGLAHGWRCSFLSLSLPLCFSTTCIAQVIPQRRRRPQRLRCCLLCALLLESFLPPSFILLPLPPMAKKYVMANAPLSEFGVLVAQLESIVGSASQQPPEALLCFDLLSDLISAIDGEPKVPLARFSFHFCPILFFSSFILTQIFTTYLYSYELGFDLVYV